MIKSNLINILTSLDVYVPSYSISLLSEYYYIVIKNNNKLNLTRIIDPVDFIYKNILDSYYLLKYISLYNGCLLDIGTGFGVPGIIIKIFLQNLNVYLLDSSLKKCNFLSYVIDKLSLKNIYVLNSRAEQLDKKFLNFFDYSTCRAFGHLLYISEVSLPYLKLNGLLICQKTPKQKSEQKDSKDHIEALGGTFLTTDDYFLNDNIRRNAIVIKKITSTPSLYPRSFNKIRRQIDIAKKSIKI